jgi:multicomponent Na+:H+ antiporter subunit G
MIDIIASLFILMGNIILLIAAIGIIRLPDLYNQIHAVGKAPTLALGLMMIGVSIHFRSFTVLGESIIIIIFIFLAAPVGSQLLARAAYQTKEYCYNPSRKDALSEYSEQNKDC